VVKGSLQRANSMPILKTRLTLQKRAAQRPLRRTVTISASQAQLRVSVQGEETFHVASHLSWLSSFFYLTGEGARAAKSMMEEEESRKAISKIRN